MISERQLTLRRAMIAIAFAAMAGLGALTETAAQQAGPTATPPPASPTVSSSPMQTPTASVAPPTTATPVLTPATARGSLKIQLVEDVNENGLRDAADAVPAQTTAVLVPWANPEKVIELVTAVDGSFTFADLPPGDYTLRLFWPAGFVSAGSSPAIPHLLRAVFRVQPDGTLAIPEPLPTTWPGLPDEKFDPAVDGTILGKPPGEIILKRKDPNSVALLPDAGESSFAFGVGSIDVAVALNSPAKPPGTLPATGDGSPAAGILPWAMPLVGLTIVACSGALAIGAHRRRGPR